MNWMCVCQSSSNSTFLYTAIRASYSLRLNSRIISKFHRLSVYASFSVKTHQLTWTLSLRRNNFEIHTTTITCNTWQAKPLQSPIPRIQRLTVSITFYRETNHRDYRESSRNNWLYAKICLYHRSSPITKRGGEGLIGGKLKIPSPPSFFSLMDIGQHWKTLE